MYIDRERECARLVGELLKAGRKLAEACKDERAALVVWNKRWYLCETSRLLDELIHTLSCRNAPAHKVEGSKEEFDRYIAGDR